MAEVTKGDYHVVLMLLCRHALKMQSREAATTDEKRLRAAAKATLHASRACARTAGWHRAIKFLQLRRLLPASSSIIFENEAHAVSFVEGTKCWHPRAPNRER